RTGSWLVLGLGACAAVAAAASSASCSATKSNEFTGAGGASDGAGSPTGSGSTGSIGSGFTGSGGMFSSSGSSMATCKVTDNGNAVPMQCDQKSPPNSFAPVVKWSFDGPPAQPGSAYTGSFSTPLVA